MPIANVIQGQPKPLTGWKYALSKVGEGLGQGLQSGIQQGASLTLNQKFQAMEDQRKFDQMNAQREEAASLAEKQGMGKYSPFIRAGMPWQQIAMLDKEGLIPEVGGQQESRRGIPSLAGLSPDNIQSKNVLLQPQFRREISQQEMERPTQPQVQVPRQELRSFDDFRKKITEQYFKGNPPEVIGKTVQERIDKAAEREFNAARELRKEEREIAAPERNRLNKETETTDALRQSSLIEDQAAAIMKSAIKSENLGALSLNNLAQQFNFPGLLSQDAAAYNAAVKEFFVGGLSSVPGSSRLNMWIEQQVKSMIPQIGNSRPAALSMMEVIEAKNSLNKERIRLHDELIEKYPNDPKKFFKERNASLENFSKNLQKQTAYNMQKIKEDDQRENNVYAFNSMNKVTKGTPLTFEKAEVFFKQANGNRSKAKKLARYFGYDDETYEQSGEK